MNKRGRSLLARGGFSRTKSAIIFRRSSMPSPVSAETDSIVDTSSVVPSSISDISISTSSMRSGSAISDLVMTTMPSRTSKRSKMAKCSSVCGMGPSSPATTRSAKSKPPAPISMVLTKRSCPGTSTMLTSVPSPRSSHAKPSSMVIPRAFSALSRSGSMPVSFSMSVDLPWSTWPAVPTTNMMRERKLRGFADKYGLSTESRKRSVVEHL